MATMVKEKRREKKKTKEKRENRPCVESVQPSLSEEQTIRKEIEYQSETLENVAIDPVESMKSIEVPASAEISNSDTLEKDCIESLVRDQAASSEEMSQTKSSPSVKVIEESYDDNVIGNTYQDLSSKLERISIPSLDPNIDIVVVEKRLENPGAYIKSENVEKVPNLGKDLENVENVYHEYIESAPSAPLFEEERGTEFFHQQHQEIQKEVIHKIQCMPLEEAMRLFGGKEMAEVRAMSEKEEAIVEAGPVSGPEHPLVDLLSTFRSSLIAVERERTQLARGFAEEEKFRNTLWKVEKRNIYVTEDCPCGTSVQLRATYEHAELVKDRLPAARMRLEALLRDVQDSYCHHQHAALLAHCQIEELISEVIKSNKNIIREALALILQALRMSDTAPPALAIALQRWAAALSTALLDGRDLRQLLHLLHHLFRQTRSVVWAASVIHISCGDHSSAAQLIALLDLLLNRTRLEAAVECSEDVDEDWEEVDERGGGSAVSDGALRERDLLALLKAFPLRDLVARVLLITHADITRARPHEWCADAARGALAACCGVRALLHVCARAHRTHAHYARLRTLLRHVTQHALHALAGVHLQARESYTKDLEDRIHAELEASFAAGFEILVPELHALPATLLREETSREYCIGYIVGLHDKTTKTIESIPVELPVLPCEVRVRTATQVALDRHYDHELARMVLDFLFQTGIKRKTVQCKGACAATARELLPRLLTTHPYLHTIAFHIVAELYQMQAIDPSAVEPLSVQTWRPSDGEVRAVLDDWANRCPLLLQHLLLNMDYTPHTGLSLASQLTIGSWLCHWLKQAPPPPEWAWSVLHRLRVHRTDWGMVFDALPPESEPVDMFSTAYAVLSSSWGHSIPEICSEGVSALCSLAAARAPSAVQCLAPVMLVMSYSPESISLTPRFTDLFNLLLKSGPTMVQRALGLGPTPGAELLLRLMINQIEEKHGSIPQTSLVSAWLHALWAAGASSHLEVALLTSRNWQLFDSHAGLLLQSTKSSEHIVTAVRNATLAPLVCECILRNAHASREVHLGVAPRLLDALHLQRTSGERIHVDNALKQIGASMTSEELVIYLTASALLSTPLLHPAHLMLWRLFFHLFLQRPPRNMLDTTPPIGPLFFSGLIKSRLLTQLRKKLQETIAYHEKEVETLKQKKKEPNFQTSKGLVKVAPVVDEGVVPALSIIDLTGESSGSDNESSEESEKEEDKSEVSESKENDALMLKYHEAAKSMCKEFLRWFDEGEKTLAMPHHADIARFIPEQALEESWNRELARRRPLQCSPPPPAPPPAPARHPSPFKATIASLLKIQDCSTKRSREITVKSPLEGVEFNDPRSLLALVDKYLGDIETLAQEWTSEVSRISSLDNALWELVSELRVRRPVPPVKKQCANKCKPLTIHIPHQEWCISPGAERGIKENRNGARALVRRLARPRPHAARSAAALTAIARHVRSLEAASRVCDRAWRCARAVCSCALAQATLTALVDYLSERWICHDGKLCAELISRWCGGGWFSGNSSAAQQALCGALLRPRRLPAQQWPLLYTAILRANLPSNAVFSYLSKFELGRWAETADPEQRKQLLEALAAAAQRWGADPDKEHHVLLELIGVHTASILNAQELCAYIVRCARASVTCSLPPSHWTHVVRAANLHARDVPFDQLGHLLRELGAVWWEARCEMRTRSSGAAHAAYSAHAAALLHAVQRAFTAAAVDLSYAPERVALYAWSGLQESWSPWLTPLPTPPLLPSTGEKEAYTPMIKHFVDNVHQIMLDCPGTEEYLLQKIFDWTVQTYLAVTGSAPQESRVQASALLAGLRALPWDEHHWVTAGSVQNALQVCACGDQELQSWCAAAWRAASAEDWLRGAPPDHTAPLLASLLYLFTAMSHDDNTLEQVSQLPWWRLPEVALEEAMERVFAQYHDQTLPYHELPQFRALLFASELYPPSPAAPAPAARAGRSKRACAVSRWVRAAWPPPLAAHVHKHCEAVLYVITNIAPSLECSEGEVEELLGRAAVIMCVEPAATAALPVWLRWVSSTTPRMVTACLSAACVLTVFEYFASLADAAAFALLKHKECGGWSEIKSRWSSCQWNDAAPLVSRARLYAAYGILRAHTHNYGQIRTAMLALMAATINFVENEAIVAVWICVAARVWRECRAAGERGEAGEGGEAGECRAAAAALLARAAEEPRRTLLQLVTMQPHCDQPTPRHRLLGRLAQCSTSHSESNVRAYEAACTAVLGSNSDVLSWGKSPHPKMLPRLAIRLFPSNENYFKDELDLAPED